MPCVFDSTFLVLLTNPDVLPPLDPATEAPVELAALNREALDTGDKRTGTDAPWSKVKFDRQIVAIAKVVRADCIYSDDDDLKTFGTNAGIPVFKLHEIELPPEERQGSLDIDDT